MFRDRREAGEVLARRLRDFADRDDVVVLALPRGGVPVAFVVASELGVPLDVFAVRKLGVPWQPELAMGAIASGGVRVLNEEVIRQLRISRDALEEVAEEEERELARRDSAYRGGRPRPELRGKAVILVDDGLATGSTMRAAVKAMRELGPARVVVAVPVGAADTCRELGRLADEVVCAETPEPFFGVGAWYNDFGQTSDEEVRDLLARSDEANAR